MNSDVKKIVLPDTPKMRKAVKAVLDQKADRRLHQKKALADHAAKLKKPAL